MLSRAGPAGSSEGILEYQSHLTESATTRFSRRTAIKTIVILLCVVIPAAYWVWSRTIAQNCSRIEREHGLVLPASAANFVCKGDAYLFLDRSAVSSFTMSAADVPKFVSQLKPGGPGSSPWATGSWGALNNNGVAQYDCLSQTGDFLTVGIRPLGAGQVHVYLYTDWN